jgi:hypothetical protein
VRRDLTYLVPIALMVIGCARSRPEPADAGARPPSSSPVTPASPSAPAASASSTPAPPAPDTNDSGRLAVACDPIQKTLVLFDPKATSLERVSARPDASGTVAVHPIAPGDPPFDCKLNDASGVRLKLGGGPGMPYGECGADPSLFVSVWIDEAKVLSAKNYSGMCLQEERPFSHARVTEKSVTWCTGKVKRGDPLDPNHLECTETRTSSAPKKKDIAEFPPPGAHREKAGTILVDHAAEPALCTAMARRNPEGSASTFPLLPPPTSDVNLLKTVDFRGEATNIVYRGRFDLDNDGADDDVLLLRSLTHAHDGDELLASPSLAIPDRLDDAALEALRKRARHRFPGAWATGASRYDAGYYEIKNLRAEPRSTGVQPGSAVLRTTSLRFRYTHLEPFRYQGVTYLITSPPDWAVDDTDTFVVFRPRPGPGPGRALEETCVVHQVQENF